MNRNLRIGDLIDVPPVQTVIRLEDGHHNTAAISAGFVFTPEVQTHLNIVADALMRPHGQGFFLQGDFGSGKSHFLACLAAWIENRPGTERLTDQHVGLAQCRAGGRRLLAVDLSLVNFRAATPLERLVVAAIDDAFARHGQPSDLSPLSGFMTHLRTLLENSELAADFADAAGIAVEEVAAYLHAHPRQAYAVAVPFMQQKRLAAADLLVPERHETFNRIMAQVRGAGFDGIVLLIDELSEFLRSKPDARALNEDARTLQLLGELATSEPIWIVAAVQESIERTGDLAQVTFQKIKDRFPVKLVLSSVHIQALISGRLVQRKPGADQAILDLYNYFKAQFTSFRWTWEQFNATYPVHPVTIALLDGLGDLFSVHRGIVDFVHAQVAGDRQRNIIGILQRPCHELLGPDSIYDHFSGRMAEVTGLHAFVRYVVPHLDEVIQQVVEDPADQQLTRRLVRVLVLYRIHPTVQTPDVRGLTEQVACALSDQDPDLSVQFVGEVLLDPVVAESRFLIKQPAGDNDPCRARYEVRTQEDPVKTLKAKIARMASDLTDDDTRVLAGPLAELNESVSWPGPALWHNGLPRLIQWAQSNRKAQLFFVQSGAEVDQSAQLMQRLKQGAIDFAMALSIGTTPFSVEHCAVWQIPFPPEATEHAVLKEYLAARQILAVLKPGRQSDDRLLPTAQEHVQRLQPAARQAALKTFYAGRFVHPDIHVEPVIRQLMRFDRLLETAGAALLPKRYPNHSMIAPRRLTPSPRLYQQLLDDFVTPGKITLREARSARLAEAIEDLAMPLGLAELRSGSYLLAPDPANHHLLSQVFGTLHPAGPTPMAEMTDLLQTGPYGLTADATAFLLLALAHAGLIGLTKSSRVQPLDFLSMAGFSSMEALVPGELISRADRETLLSRCDFLLPAGIRDTFGLRQQRDVWQAVIQFKHRMENRLSRIAQLMTPVAQFSAFQRFDRDALERRTTAMQGLISAVKVSYTARQGLERFVAAWRASGLNGADVAYLNQLEKFLTKQAEAYVFANHYVQHAAVARAAADNAPIDQLRQTLMVLFDTPEVLLEPDREDELAEAFEAFRRGYVQYYIAGHDQYYQSLRPQSVSRPARRALALLEQLSHIETLDRPEALDRLLAATQKQRNAQCHRNLAEELLRAPLCGCGYSFDKTPQKPLDVETLIDTCLTSYLTILKNAEVREAITARLFALGDSQGERLRPLERFQSFLNDPAASPAGLLELWDGAVAEQMDAALRGRYTVERRNLGALAARLGGRRLPLDQMLSVVREWAAPSSDQSVIAVVNDADGGMAPDLTADAAARSEDVAWWSGLHPELGAVDRRLDPAQLEQALQAHYPAEQFKSRLERMTEDALACFILQEPYHTSLIQSAWQLLLDRSMAAQQWFATPGDAATSRHCQPAQAAAIDNRLDHLRCWLECQTAPWPQRLTTRIHLSALAHDAWTSVSSQIALQHISDRLARDGHDWLHTLPPLPALDVSTHPVVIILDGLSPDVWLEACRMLDDSLRPAEEQWFRLPAAAATAPAVAAQFGLAEDPLDALAARGIVYEHLKGNESGAVDAYLPPVVSGQTTVVHLSLLDRSAHSGRLRLHEMPFVTVQLLNAILPRLQNQCRQCGCMLVLTADHGLSLTPKGLRHGNGGVFEQALVRAVWRLGQGGMME